MKWSRYNIARLFSVPERMLGHRRRQHRVVLTLNGVAVMGQRRYRKHMKSLMPMFSRRITR